MGYRLMRLDTGTFLEASRHLYASLGFVETGPYYDVPLDVLRVTVFFELPLRTLPGPLSRSSTASRPAQRPGTGIPTQTRARDTDPGAYSDPGRSTIRGFAPIVGREPRVLVLGTVPSELSLREGSYYAHPRNDFWPIMEALFSDGRPLGYEERVAMLRRAGVALWDVLDEAAARRQSRLRHQGAGRQRPGRPLVTTLPSTPSSSTAPPPNGCLPLTSPGLSPAGTCDCATGATALDQPGQREHLVRAEAGRLGRRACRPHRTGYPADT